MSYDGETDGNQPSNAFVPVVEHLLIFRTP